MLLSSVLTLNIKAVSLNATLSYSDIILIALMIYISIVDILYYIIPDIALVIGISLNLMISAFNNVDAILSSILNMSLMALITYIIAVLMRKIFKEDCIGFGDIKLFGLIGMYLGFYHAIGVFIVSFYIAGFIGVIYFFYSKFRNKGIIKNIPFAPSIFVATVIAILF